MIPTKKCDGLEVKQVTYQNIMFAIWLFGHNKYDLKASNRKKITKRYISKETNHIGQRRANIRVRLSILVERHK